MGRKVSTHDSFETLVSYVFISLFYLNSFGSSGYLPTDSPYMSTSNWKLRDLESKSCPGQCDCHQSTSPSLSTVLLFVIEDSAGSSCLALAFKYII